MVDAISDMLTRIRNAQAARHAIVVMPSSKLKFAIARVLQKEGYVGEVKSLPDAQNDKISDISIELLYENITQTRKIAKIKGLELVSKQGQRRYVRSRDIIPVMNGYGTSIISTSQGVMNAKDARKRGLGGEMICKVW